MARLVDECKARLPRAFETEEFERRKSAIFEDLHRRQHAEMEHLDEAARAERFVVLRSPAASPWPTPPAGSR